MKPLLDANEVYGYTCGSIQDVKRKQEHDARVGTIETDILVNLHHYNTLEEQAAHLYIAEIKRKTIKLKFARRMWSKKRANLLKAINEFRTEINEFEKQNGK